jgi:hypothetical protein
VRSVRAEVRRAAGAIEPTFYSRFECKYLIEPALVPEVRQFLRPFARPDPYAALCRGYRYPICSLYLDSQDLALYQQTVGGEKNRFKLRVRTYTDDPTKPAYLEVKRKLNTIVHKRRAGLSREQARRVWNRQPFDASRLSPDDRRDAEYFYQHVAMIEARPVIRVKYMREAYVADGNEPVRVTLDTDLMHAITLGDDLRSTEGRWTTTPVRGVILEIKFTERFPWWVQDLIRTFGLTQRAVPKYVWSVDHMLLDGRESALSVAGLALPPRRRT